MELYLSRLRLDPRSRAVRRDLADCHALHRTVMSGFPDLGGGEAARARLGVLHRLDVEPRTGAAVLLIQSRARPDWTGLGPAYLLAGDGTIENPACKSVAEVYDRLATGALLCFRLRANPTKRLSTPAGPDGRHPLGKRVDLRREADQLAWFRRKGEQGGFEPLPLRSAPGLADVRANPAGPLAGVRLGVAPAAGQRLAFGAVLFEGRLRVTDAVAFRRTLEAGIGSGKAYGFGLLSLAPLGAEEG